MTKAALATRHMCLDAVLTRLARNLRAVNTSHRKLDGAANVCTQDSRAHAQCRGLKGRVQHTGLDQGPHVAGMVWPRSAGVV